MAFSEREFHGEGRSLADNRGHGYLSVMLTNDILRQIQAYSGSHFGQGFNLMSLIEAVENM